MAFEMLKKGGLILEKFIKFIIAISLVILAINSFFISAYLKNIVELIAALVNSH